MGASGKKQTVGYKYYMGLHFALCYGPVDKVKKILVGDRIAKAVDITTNSQVTISEPNLFGGDKREGGIEGKLEVMMGGTAQTLPTLVASLLPSPSPAFRGILSMLYDGLISANNPYVKPWAFKIERVLQGWHGGSAWYPEKAAISAGSSFGLSTVTEPFNNIDAWTRVAGTSDAFSIVSGELKAQPGAFVFATLEKPVPPGLIKAVDVDFKLTALGSDDGGILWFRRSNGTVAFTFNTARQLITDALRRPNIDVETLSGYVGNPMGSAACTIDENYHFRADFDYGADTITCVITQGVTTFASLTIAMGLNMTVTRAQIHVENFSPGSTTYWDNLVITTEGVTESAEGMNPAHIIFQCLTDPQWGMGYPVGSLDNTSFTAAADTLAAEGFGLCMIWNQQEELGQFIRTVLDHIGGILYDDPLTGKFALKLLRGDYVVGSLEVFDETKIVSLDSFQRVGYGDTINEITVVYRDVLTNKDVPITVHNLANIQAQGAVVSQTRQYPGLPNVGLASRVAQRDLIASSTPLAKARMTVNRSAWSLAPGGVFKLSWSKLGLTSIVMRVLAIDYGSLIDGTIVVEIAEDVFGLPAASYVAQEPAGWVPPATQPQVVSVQDIAEVPYRSLVSEMGPADLAILDPDAAYFGVLAAAPGSTALGFDIYSRVGAAAYSINGTGAFIPSATTSAALSMSDTSIVLATQNDLDSVDVDSLAVIGSGSGAEWVKVKTINVGTLTITVARGVLDTTPSEHIAGERIFFDDARSGFDEVERATTETVNFKLATQSTGGALDYTAATTMTGTAQQRQFRPYPPGKVQIGGVDWPTVVTVPIVVTWAHRDRLQQTAYFVEQDEVSIGPEVGTTYNAYLYEDSTGSLLESLTGIAGTSWSPALLGTFTVRLEIEAQRDGVVSWQRQVRLFTFNTSGRLTEDGLDRLTENNEFRSQE